MSTTITHSPEFLAIVNANNNEPSVSSHTHTPAVNLPRFKMSVFEIAQKSSNEHFLIEQFRGDDRNKFELIIDKNMLRFCCVNAWDLKVPMSLLEEGWMQDTTVRNKANPADMYPSECFKLHLKPSGIQSPTIAPGRTIHGIYFVVEVPGEANGIKRLIKLNKAWQGAQIPYPKRPSTIFPRMQQNPLSSKPMSLFPIPKDLADVIGLGSQQQQHPPRVVAPKPDANQYPLAPRVPKQPLSPQPGWQSTVPQRNVTRQLLMKGTSSVTKPFVRPGPATTTNVAVPKEPKQLTSSAISTAKKTPSSSSTPILSPKSSLKRPKTTITTGRPPQTSIVPPTTTKKQQHDIIVLEDEDQPRRRSNRFSSSSSHKYGDIDTKPTPLFIYPTHGLDCVYIYKRDRDRCVHSNIDLNDSVVDYWLKKEVDEFRLARRGDPAALTILDSHHIFSSFLYSRMAKRLVSSRREKDLLSSSAHAKARFQAYAMVRTWSRGFDVFCKKWMIIPVNGSSHWSCLVVRVLNPLQKKPVTSSGVTTPVVDMDTSSVSDDTLSPHMMTNDDPPRKRERLSPPPPLPSEESTPPKLVFYHFDSLKLHSTDQVGEVIRIYFSHEWMARKRALEKGDQWPKPPRSTNKEREAVMLLSDNTSDDDDNSSVEIVEPAEISNNNNGDDFLVNADDDAFPKGAIKYHSIACPSQDDGNSCGVFTLHFASFLLNNFESLESNVDDVDTRAAEELENIKQAMRKERGNFDQSTANELRRTILSTMDNATEVYQARLRKLMEEKKAGATATTTTSITAASVASTTVDKENGMDTIT